MTNEQYQFWRLLVQLREWEQDVSRVVRNADDKHWLIRVEKSVLIDGLRQLADRLEKISEERKKEAA